jgi:spore germination cell wall hydrolase CwlJ-like protein
MKKVFLFLIMFLIVGAYGNNGAIESTPEEKIIIQNDMPHFMLEFDNTNKIYNETEKQITCMAKNIFYEAATESTAGKLAVAQVTLNRVKSSRFPNTVCEVVYEGPTYRSGLPKRDRCQFSWYCDGKGDDPKEGRLWSASVKLAKHVFRYKENMVDITDGATHYHANYIANPRWADRTKVTTSIDQHIFYRFFRL